MCIDTGTISVEPQVHAAGTLIYLRNLPSDSESVKPDIRFQVVACVESDLFLSNSQRPYVSSLSTSKCGFAIKQEFCCLQGLEG